MRFAFTLIELLVVITIIVVLLALLTPALDRAIEQAELAVCGTHLKTIGTGSVTYAAAARRQYAYRKNVREGDNAAAGPETLQLGGLNDRAAVSQTIPYGAMVCPLSGQVNLGPERGADGINDGWVLSSYSIYAGYQFRRGSGGPTEAGMLRLGDRFAWAGNRFGVLAADMDAVSEQDRRVAAAHPDDQGVMINLISDRQVAPTVTQLGELPGFLVATTARWANDRTHERGLIIKQIVFSDGGVGRFEKISRFKLDPQVLEDEGMRLLPTFRDGPSPNSTTGDFWTSLPTH